MASADTVMQTATSIRSGQRSAVEVMRECLDRIEASRSSLHAFVSVHADRALARARAIDRDRSSGEALGPLAGVPIAIKDNLCTTAGDTTCGSRMLKGFRSQYDAHVVERLDRAGAIVVGKTNLDEFAMGSSTEHGCDGATRNPWDASRVAGGSSGGSAAAVAARVVPAALGSDTGGSIRQPASFCGVVGVKPTYGRVSRYGLVAFGSSLDQIGPITTTAEDAALILSVIAGHDPRDSTSVARPVPNYTARLDRPLRGLRVGVADDHAGDGLDPRVADAVASAIDVLRSRGAEVRSVSLPHLRYAVACYYIIAPAEASSNLARFDGVRYGYRPQRASDTIDLYATSRGRAFGAEVKRRIMLGTYVLSSGYYDAYYLRALKARTLIRRDFESAFDRVDVIVSPTVPTTAFGLGEKIDDPLTMYLADVYTIAANLAGTPAISVPVGFDDAGLPIGMQLTGPAFGEETILGVAHQYEQLTDYHQRRPAAGE